jgi:hypothetical protein
METVIKEKEGTDIKEEKSGKRKWLSRFVNFLMYGGWLLIVLFIVGVVILISYLG